MDERFMLPPIRHERLMLDSDSDSDSDYYEDERVIDFDSDALNAQQVVGKIQEGITRNESLLCLMLCFRGVAGHRLGDTVNMQNGIVENIMHIKNIKFSNICYEKNENIRCFNFFIRIIQNITGERKNIEYYNNTQKFDALSLEGGVDKLANAIRSNTDGVINSFCFIDCYLNPVTLQPLWDALLETGVRKLLFNSDGTPAEYINKNYDSININFIGLSTNTSLKELHFEDYIMYKRNCINLFDSIAVNKGLEKLELHIYIHDADEDDNDVLQECFKKMLRTNSTLLDVTIHIHGWDILQQEITIETEINRNWKRYFVKGEERRTAAAVVATTVVAVAADIGNNDNNIHNNNIVVGDVEIEQRNNEEDKMKKKEEEKAKIFQMRMLLNLFMHKPVFRDTIIFILLSDYRYGLFLIDDSNDDDDDDNNNEAGNEHPIILDRIRRMLRSYKRRRSSSSTEKLTSSLDEDYNDNENNDGDDDDDDDDDEGHGQL